jgi:DNA polymerase III sliding clamp (beta) subunit (PCNA family)
LLAALKKVTKATAARTHHTELSGVLFDTNLDKRTLTLSATDLSVSMQIILKDVEVDWNGKAVVHAKMLADMLGNMTADDAYVVSKQGGLRVQCGKSIFSAPVMDAEKFPNIIFAYPETTICVSGIALVSKQVASIVSEKNSNPAFGGVQMRFTPGISTAISTDGARFVKAKNQNIADGLLDLFLPERALKILLGIVRAGDDLYVGVINNSVVFMTSEFVFTTRLTDTNLNKIEETIKKIVPVCSVTVNAQELSQAVDFCISMVAGVDSCVNVTLKNEAMVLSVDNENGSTEFEVEAKNAKDLQGKVYHYRPNFIYDFLRSCAGDVTVDFDKQGIMILRSDTTEYIVMPRTAARIKEAKVSKSDGDKATTKKEKIAKTPTNKKKGKAAPATDEAA